MSEQPNAFLDAIADREPTAIRRAIVGSEFVLVSMSDGDEDNEDGSGALTAEIDGEDALVVFTTEELAGQFVKEQSELFDDTEEVEGLVVEGRSLLEYLPDGYGMLIDPEADQSAMIEPELAAMVVTAKD